MKAPDKVYVNKEKNNVVYSLSVQYDNGGEEYIRKNALLEKLEKASASYKKRNDEGELVWQNMCGIKEAIEILNSM